MHIKLYVEILILICYNVFNIPALTAFTVAASIALRRIQFTKTGFFIQFVGPSLFVMPLMFA